MNWRSVVFQKPQHNSIIQEGFTAVDMHNHSQYSDTTTPITTIAKKARNRSIDPTLCAT